MSTLAEIEKAILGLPAQEKLQLIDWMERHYEELAPLSEAQRVEMNQRQEELRARPELAQPMDASFFERLRRKVAEVARSKRKPRLLAKPGLVRVSNGKRPG
jgi:hypothetical protein